VAAGNKDFVLVCCLPDRRLFSHGSRYPDGRAEAQFRCSRETAVRYDFLIDMYETERIKVISAWSMFRDEDLPVRPNAADPRGRSFHEHMVHQCMSEDVWFRTMLDIDVGAPPLPEEESRLEFMRRYAEDSGKRLAVLRDKDESWWEGETKFFGVARSRAWVITRRMTHTSHHRGQQLALLRMLGREQHSNYGPTADTGGLMQNHAPTIYPYANLEALFEGEAVGGRKAEFPGMGALPVTERPEKRR
jgi:uncharacterized damage-inducible protein DinB